ncbi:cytochrome P450 [Gigaspora margarita]|uniref:Cytochrome P450 n=1 Tax=Gigaspora margarita TaxID=4874 RepID=A0A8H3WTA5_GIGMA|nr:cytochrome P450 [Gigaspora margarita]
MNFSIVENFITSIFLITVKDWLLISFIIILIYVIDYYYKYFTRENPLPGPLPLPCIGNLYLFHGDLDIVFYNLQEKYGELFEIYLGSDRKIWLGNASLVEKIHNPSTKTKFPIRAISEGLDEMGVTTKGIAFNNDLVVWKFNRRIISSTIMENNNYVLNFPDWSTRFFADAISLASIGKPARMMATQYNRLVPKYLRTLNSKSGLYQFEEFLDRLRLWLKSVHFFYFVPRFVRHYIPPMNFLYKKYIHNMTWIDNYLIGFVKERRKEIENTPKEEALSSDILTLLICANTDRDKYPIKSNDKFSRPMTDEEIRYCIFEVIGGGIDTTAHSTSFLIHYLCKNPEKKAKVYAEIDNIFKGDKTRPVTYDDIEKLVYVEAAAKESSRLMPIVPSVFKRAINDVMIGGLNWKTGQEFFVHQHYIHHNKSHWPNPEKFIPERFLGDTNKIEKNSFIPFGGGIRQCPGRHLGMTGIKTFIALLFRKYEVSLEDPKAPLKKVYTLANECHELKLYIRPRKD